MRAKCQHSVVIERQTVSSLCLHRKTERLLLPMNVVDWMQTNIGTDSEREAAHANKLDSRHSLVSGPRGRQRGRLIEARTTGSAANRSMQQFQVPAFLVQELHVTIRKYCR
jgi:hypothetical protein